jgi:hypothetical protein
MLVIPSRPPIPSPMVDAAAAIAGALRIPV